MTEDGDGKLTNKICKQKKYTRSSKY